MLKIHVKPMNTNLIINNVKPFLFMLLLITGGCSSSYQQPPHQPQTGSQANTQLPEVVRPNTHRQSPRVSSTTVQRPRRPVRPQRPRQVVKQKPILRNKPKPAATVHRYSDKPKIDVITQREVQSVLGNSTKSTLVTPPKQVKTGSEASAYANIPDSSDNRKAPRQHVSSPAVKSLIIRARADMAIGRDQSAISKIERALRIESDNGELWYLLAKAHQASSNHQQAITMAKKAINFAGANEMLAIKSWKLIKLSGEASGDTVVVQEAINYNKINR